MSEIQLWECLRCSLSFFEPDSIAGSGNLYAQLEKFDWYYMPVKWEYSVALRDLRGCRNILEVGCGSGNFLRLAQDAGLKIEGVEQNQRAIQKASQMGLRVIEATVEEVADRATETYDAVCSFQVLEHVAKPGPFLDACCRLLRPGGRLLIGVPNADSFIRYEFNILDMPPHHMSRWPVKTLTDLGQFFPLALKRVLREPLADYHVASYVDAHFSHMTGGFWHSLNRPRIRSWSARALRLGLRRLLVGQTIYGSYERTPHDGPS